MNAVELSPANPEPAKPRTKPKQPVSPSRSGLLLALFMMGFGTFLNVYATQPLLPQFRQLFHASELLVSLTVSATVLAVALGAPVIGSLADVIGRKRVIVTAMFGLALPTFWPRHQRP